MSDFFKVIALRNLTLKGLKKISEDLALGLSSRKWQGYSLILET